MTEEQKAKLATLCNHANVSPPDFRADGTIRISSPSPIPIKFLQALSLHDFEFVETGDWPVMADRVDDMKYEHYAVMRPRFD